MSEENPDLARARDVLAKVIQTATKNPEAAFADDAIQAAAILEDQDFRAYASYRRNLKERHVTVRFFDDLLDKFKREQREEDAGSALTALVAPTGIMPWGLPVSGDVLITEIRTVINATLSLPDGAPDVIALWTVFTHAIDSFDLAPILSITSPVKNCGKTKAMELLERQTRRPYLSSNVTASAVFRMIDAEGPTLLIDEANTFVGLRPELQNVLNSGYRRSGSVTKFIDGQVTRFSTFGAKAVAGIGKLPDNWASKSIAITMKRKRRDEKLTPLSIQHAHLEDLMRKAMRWAEDNGPALRTATPAPLDADLDTRVQDNWRPLLAIAEAISTEYAAQIRDIAIRLARSSNDDTILLDDIREIFKSLKRTKLSSEQLCHALRAQPDRPYKDEHLTQYKLSQKLAEFEIRPHTIRAASRNGKPTAKGYTLEDFADAFERYVTK